MLDATEASRPTVVSGPTLVESAAEFQRLERPRNLGMYCSRTRRCPTSCLRLGHRPPNPRHLLQVPKPLDLMVLIWCQFERQSSAACQDRVAFPAMRFLRIFCMRYVNWHLCPVLSSYRSVSHTTVGGHGRNPVPLSLFKACLGRIHPFSD